MLTFQKVVSAYPSRVRWQHKAGPSHCDWTYDDEPSILLQNKTICEIKIIQLLTSCKKKIFFN